VADNVALPLIIAGVPKRAIDKRVRAAPIKSVSRKEKNRPLESRREQQRVASRVPWWRNPALLIADEPTGNLDPDLSLEIMKLFQTLQ